MNSEQIIKIFCDECTDSHSATYYCIDCKANLCDEQYRLHIKSRKTKDHTYKLLKIIDSRLIENDRECVRTSYETAKTFNKRLFHLGEPNATSEYIFENQIIDADKIVDMFYTDKRRVVSVQKLTKIGADGLMLRIAYSMTTHPDDDFVVELNNVRIITGMSNKKWEDDLIEKAPLCFKDKIFHHDKLKNAKLNQLKNALIIIDEIDSGSKAEQVLHRTLKDSGIFDANYMVENNIRFAVVSATMLRQSYELCKWGELHSSYKMTVPTNYIGHKDFLKLNIIQEFYPLNSKENIEKWIKEDIINNYREDFRVHIARVDNRIISKLESICYDNNIIFKNHNSEQRLSDKEIKEFFENKLKGHVVIAVKGLLRRANIIPNKWKLRIGSVHEMFVKTVDNNVQIQGLVGRMTGYWRNSFENGHKSGPYRTSIKAIKEYIKIYENPFGYNDYQSSDIKKKNGKITTKTSSMVEPSFVPNLVEKELINIDDGKTVPIVLQITETEFKQIKKNGSEWDINTIKNIIKNHSFDVYNEISLLEKDTVMKSNINVLTHESIKAYELGKKYYWMGHSKKLKLLAKNIFQIFIDDTQYRLVINRYYQKKHNLSVLYDYCENEDESKYNLPKEDTVYRGCEIGKLLKEILREIENHIDFIEKLKNIHPRIKGQLEEFI